MWHPIYENVARNVSYNFSFDQEHEYYVYTNKLESAIYAAFPAEMDATAKASASGPLKQSFLDVF